MLKPAILIIDPDLIRNVLITDFHYFRENDIYLSLKNDPLLAANPFFRRDKEWRESRHIILPAFTQIKVFIWYFISTNQIYFNKNPHVVR